MAYRIKMAVRRLASDYEAYPRSPDGVVGIRGIGAKTAAGLLKVATLDVLLAQPALAATASVRGAKGLPGKLEAGAAVAQLARQLVRLRDDVPLEMATREGTVLPGDPDLGFPVSASRPDASVWSRLDMKMPR